MASGQLSGYSGTALTACGKLHSDRISEFKVKKLALFVLLVAPGAGLAAGYGGAEGRNKAGEIIHFAADAYYELLVQKGDDDHEWAERYDLNVECPGFVKAMGAPQGGSVVFACPAGRGFPLSGATFRITTSRAYQPCDLDPYFDKSPGTIYECIAGCAGKRVPKLFRESPWEC